MAVRVATVDGAMRLRRRRDEAVFARAKDPSEFQQRGFFLVHGEAKESRVAV
jgi:hypothetical protein